MITPEQMEQWNRDGYILVRGLFDAEEMAILRETAVTDETLQEAAQGLKDGEGGVTRISGWNQAGDDAYGLVARSHRVVDLMEAVLGGEVYHYHSKMNMKEAFTGGAWAWHQDYGYWYNNGCLLPDMASCFIAVDPCTRENGCMQVLKGSHLMGRIEHGTFGDQTGADPERVEAASEIMELVYVEMEPGDALFFHSNTLHRSDQNKSPHPRWTLICCYNTKHNSPYKDGPHPRYEPLGKVPDSALKEAGVRTANDAGSFWQTKEESLPTEATV